MGHKTILCAAEITVVGHHCMIDRRLVEVDRVGVIEWWPACNRDDWSLLKFHKRLCKVSRAFKQSVKERHTF